ncbi:type VI secretion system contractile sheath small subunit [Thetidibacter halocola]|uniref:Type VI secretion system contractile sheath small subunit n=1 Tax=Thetidibacter halocola TaxID=2827239 RepID=A0A8J7WE77_9RHOB|nr:type VI secretion system contractile sheath small subunit [Thetidibacter halocola]MBS0123564.1 type VI secretion system contractile sheath small subunit [Thetidibacter halocola]
MAADSGSGYIKRNRPPRVQIAYQDPYDSEKMVELPFVMGVMADLSGNNPGVDKEDVGEREFRPVTKNTLDDLMASVEPGLSLTVDNRIDTEAGDKLGVELRFSSMKDLEPTQIARQVPAMKKLLEAREHLAELKRYLNSKPKAQAHVKRLLEDPELLRALAGPADKDAE